jgi:hypothetical protein
MPQETLPTCETTDGTNCYLVPVHKGASAFFTGPERKALRWAVAHANEWRGSIPEPVDGQIDAENDARQAALDAHDKQVALCNQALAKLKEPRTAKQRAESAAATEPLQG